MKTPTEKPAQSQPPSRNGNGRLKKSLASHVPWIFIGAKPIEPRLVRIVKSRVTRVIAGQKVSVERIEYVTLRGVRECGEAHGR